MSTESFVIGAVIGVALAVVVILAARAWERR
jgi:hypothetical protein